MQFHATLLQKNVAVSIGEVLAIDVKKTYGETTGPKERMAMAKTRMDDARRLLDALRP